MIHRILRVLQIPRNKPFADVWTRRLWRDWRKHISQAEADEWCQSLADCHTGDWHRLIVTKWTGDAFVKTSQAFEVARWLHATCEGKLMVSPRGRSDIHMGVQIWCANWQDVAIINMMATQVSQVRTFSHADFVDHMRMKLNWMVK